MKDYSQFPAPREVPVGGSISSAPSRGPNRNLTFGLLGCAFLCLCVVIAAAAFTVTIPGIGAPLISFDSISTASPNSSRATATNTPRSSSSATGQPTPVPFSRSSTSSNGLKLTVTDWQRPLPAQGVKVPDGQELALASLRLENTQTTGTAIKLRPTDFYLITSESEQYNPTVGGITSGGTMLTTMDLKPGDIFEGDLIYYIRTDVTDLSLAWKSADGVRLFSLQRGK